MLSDWVGVPHISSGDLLREAMSAGTPVGRKAKSDIDAGQLVPDQVMLEVMEVRWSQADCRRGFVLDGFPRTEAQARALDDALGQMGGSAGNGWRLDGVLLLAVDDDEIVERLSGRRICRDCGASYHLAHVVPRQAGVCDRCGGELHQRGDDRRETIRERLRVYREQTAPLEAYYARRGILRRVHGRGTVEAVAAAVREAVAAIGSRAKDKT